MAGRAQKRLRDPNRPSPKSNTLILHFAVDVKRLVAEGRGCVVHVLCFSGRTLGTHSYNESDRINLRHSTAPDTADKGLWLPLSDTDDGVQTRHPGRTALAKAKQLAAAGSCDSRRRVRRWCDEKGSLNDT